MLRSRCRRALRLLVVTWVAVSLGPVARAAEVPRVADGQPAGFPAPLVDDPLAPTHGEASVVLAGGCFWGVQAVFQHVAGVLRVTSGYTGGKATTANYRLVSTGATGHAESVRVVYDPASVTLGRLLEVFFAVAHDPTQLNRQDPDFGPQYRSAIFTADEAQARLATAYVRQLDAARVFRSPIVTEIGPLQGFYPAEATHQNYLEKHPNDPYVLLNDWPKLDRLRARYPGLYAERRAGS